jgi:hypothetical protein
MIAYIDRESGVFNQKEVIEYVDMHARKFFGDLREKISEIMQVETRRTIEMFRKFGELLDLSAADKHDVPNIEFSLQDISIEDLSDSMAAGLVSGAILAVTGFGLLASAGLVVPLLAGVAYVAGQIGKAKFKRRVSTKVEEIASEAKRHLQASEPQIAGIMKKMVRKEGAPA